MAPSKLEHGARESSLCFRSETRQVLTHIVEVSSPVQGLQDATDVIQKRLNVELVSIHGISSAGCSVYLASSGDAAALVKGNPVLSGTSWSTSTLSASTEPLYYTASSDNNVSDLPRDWQLLHAHHGLHSFLAVPVLLGDTVLGVLTVAHSAPDQLQGEAWSDRMETIAVGLVPALSEPPCQYLCHLLELAGASDCARDFAAMMMQGLRSYMAQSSGLLVNLRLAMLPAALLGTGLSSDACMTNSGSTTGTGISDITSISIFQQQQKALIFESAPLEQLPDSSALSPSAPAVGEVNVDDLQAIVVQLQGSLLQGCVSAAKPRLIADCVKHLQGHQPVNDIFCISTSPVASLLVLPLAAQGTVVGALYMTTPQPATWFQEHKPKLLALAELLAVYVGGRLSRSPTYRQLLSKCFELYDGPAVSSELVCMGSASMRGAKANLTAPMVQVLKQQIQSMGATGRKSKEAMWLEGLTISKVLGKGGFGTVYKGTFKGVTAAIKVLYAARSERQASKDAMELAVLTAIKHPHIVQVYGCFTNMVEDSSRQQSALATSPAASGLHFRQLEAGEGQDAVACSLLVMECCEGGTLRQALSRGLFHRQAQAAAGGRVAAVVDMEGVLQVLLEVAQALEHLHEHNLLHGDIKPENVMLKLDPSKRSGISTKLTDLGLAKLLRDNYYVVNRSGSGTVTHLAPELFQAGSKVTKGVDTYAYGIMMWELFCGSRVYSGMKRESIVSRVLDMRRRPEFPASCPAAYRQLAQACWAADYSDRPSMQQVMAALLAMQAQMQQQQQQQPAIAASPSSELLDA